MNSEQCVKMLEALESGCQSEAVFWAALVRFVENSSPSESEQLHEAQLRVAGMAGAEAELAAERRQSAAEQPALKPKKVKAAVGGGGAAAAEAPKEHRPPSSWNLLVSQTVSEMKQRGWESWTTVEGVVWPGSKWGPVKDKTGAVSEQFVYASGEHEGKAPSPALGGMLRASYLKTQSDPAHAAKAAAHRAARVAQLAEKRSVGSASASAAASDAEDEVVAKKARAKKMADMTEEEKAAAKAKRAANKAERAAKKAAEAEAVVAPIEGLQGEWAEE